MYKRAEPESIKEMFGTIATDYDRANQVLSFGLAKRWNEALVKELTGSHLLDLCAGTGEIAFSFLNKNRGAQATLLDFCPEMLEVARQKGASLTDRFETVIADAEALPLENGSVDAISVAYGIRNVNNTFVCLSECFRVLKPQGILGILELTRPSSPFLHLPHQLYLSTILPLLGKYVARNKKAYEYLSKSISSFSSPALLEELLKKVGFQSVVKKPLMGGVATLLVARK